MAGVADRVLGALESSDLIEGPREIVLDLLRDDEDVEGLPDDEAGPIYLSGVDVEGFRGIGPRSTLPLIPGNGLTLVVGANGSGKSSFAEALERAITGSTRRYDRSTADGRENWRNVHHDARTTVSARFQRRNDDGPSTLSVSWASDEGFSDGERIVAGPAQPTEGPAPAWLEEDWADQLELYPPLLPYTELAALVDGKPSELFDQFDRLLGLGVLENADATIGKEVKAAKALLTAAREAKKRAEAVCSESDLEPVQELSTRIAPRSSGDQARAMLNELTERYRSAGHDQALAAYIGLLDVDGDELQRRVDACAARRSILDQLTNDELATVEQTNRLLRQALDLHASAAHADGEPATMPCPVCGVGELDESWRQNAMSAVAAADERLASLNAERNRLDADIASAAEMLVEIQDLSVHPAVPSSGELFQVRERIISGLRAPTGADTLARDVSDLPTLVALCRSEATSHHDAESDAARPAIEALTAWADAVDKAAGAKERRDAHDAARAWLRSQIQVLRGERLEDLAEHAHTVWRHLRTSSSIELGPLTLEGSATRRRLDLTCTTEGKGAMARSVLSQGELHAIALSLFLPRALHADSPFGFLVIDDPVQALDRMKVDGLAEVLEGLAQQRQVVVFTHDDRLPDAVLRLGYDATIIRVERGHGSVVKAEASLGPADRAMRDATTLARDDDLDRDLAARAVAGCCRVAVEARALRKFRRDATERGVSVRQIDEQVEDAGSSLWNRVSLALEGQVVNNMRDRLSSKGGRGRQRADLIGRLNSGGHDKSLRAMADPVRMLEDTRSLLAELLPE